MLRLSTVFRAMPGSGSVMPDEVIRCPECNCTEQEGHAERCPYNRKTIACCPECGAYVGGLHAERCPFKEPPKAPDDRSTLERTVEDWAVNLADEIPKPRTYGWKTKLPIETESRQRIVAPDSRPLGMQSQIVVEKSGPAQLWETKRLSQPCFSCTHYSREQFKDKDRAELAIFLQREASWDPQAIKLILDDPQAWGICAAHSAGADSLHVSHRLASCLRLYQPKSKGWLRSLGGAIFGGSGRHGF